MTDLIKRDDALLPCPFCGGEASKIPNADHYSTGWSVGCFSGKCDIEPYVWADHLSTAVMQWNTRALPAIDPAAIREAALREAAAICIGVSNDVWTQIGREHAPYMKATAEDCSKMILSLIGEKK